MSNTTAAADEMVGQIYQRLAAQRWASSESEGSQLLIMPRVGQSLPAYSFSVLKQTWQQFAVALGLNFVGRNDPVIVYDDFVAGPEEWKRLKTLLYSIKRGEKGPVERMQVEQLRVQCEDDDLYIIAPYFVLNPDNMAASSLPPTVAPLDNEPTVDLNATMQKVIASFEKL